MTAKITLTWDNGSSEHVDQIVYRSTETFTVDNLPPILARVGRNAREFTDTDIVTGNVYFYAVASENADGEILLSSVISVTAETSTGDPHWDKVVSLLHFDGDFVDQTGKVWEPTGVPSTTYVNPAFGSGSAEKRGGTGFLLTSHAEDFIYHEDFTIEAWILTDAGSIDSMLTQYDSSGNELLPLYLDSASSGRVFWKSGDAITGLTLPVGEWFHYALTRQSGVVRAFVNGVLGGETIRNGTVGVAGGVRLLGDQGGYSGWRGQLDEFRITKGVARYTENFTPPTEPFPNF